MTLQKNIAWIYGSSIIFIGLLALTTRIASERSHHEDNLHSASDQIASILLAMDASLFEAPLPSQTRSILNSLVSTPVACSIKLQDASDNLTFEAKSGSCQNYRMPLWYASLLKAGAEVFSYPLGDTGLSLIVTVSDVSSKTIIWHTMIRFTLVVALLSAVSTFLLSRFLATRFKPLVKIEDTTMNPGETTTGIDLRDDQYVAAEFQPVISRVKKLTGELTALEAELNAIRSANNQQYQETTRMLLEFQEEMARTLKATYADSRLNSACGSLSGTPGTDEMSIRLKQLFDNLLDLYRLQNNRVDLFPAPIFAHAVVHDAVDYVKHTLSVSSVANNVPADLVIYCDAIRLTQLLAGLLLDVHLNSDDEVIRVYGESAKDTHRLVLQLADKGSQRVQKKSALPDSVSLHYRTAVSLATALAIHIEHDHNAHRIVVNVPIAGSSVQAG